MEKKRKTNLSVLSCSYCSWTDTSNPTRY